MKTKKILKKPAKSQAHKKRIQAVHSKRSIHKKIVLHPLSIFALLCLGVLLTKFTIQSFAASSDSGSYSVSAYISAPLPPTAAVITAPTDQSTTTTSPIDVSGTCPSDSYVKLYDNNLFSGVDYCASDNTFDINTSLTDGPNDLEVVVFNFDDQQGPTVPGITVTYNAPTPPSNGGGSSGGGSNNGNSGGGNSSTSTNDNGNSNKGTSTTESSPTNSTNNSVPTPPLVIETEYHYQATYSNQTYTWPISINGGTSPYALTINWGDGTQTTIAKENNKQFNISHNYKSPSPPGGYIIKITGSDATGEGVNIQLVALVNKRSGIIGSISSGSGSTAASTKDTLIAGWSAFLIIVLMAFSFWLGERQEINRILKSKRPKKLQHRRA